MARKKQPYLPLYIGDWLSNTKLKLCSAEAHGILINVMALSHKETNYGQILLKQKFKQHDEQVKNFALLIDKLLPFDLVEIERGLAELVEEEVLEIDGDYLVCDRMVRDAALSDTRAGTGSKGGKKSSSNKKELAQAKIEANSDIDIDNEIDNENKDDNIIISDFQKLNEELLVNSDPWLQDLSTTFKVKDIGKIRTALTKFLWLQRSSDNLYRTVGSIKSHFVNYVNNKPEVLKVASTGVYTAPKISEPEVEIPLTPKEINMIMHENVMNFWKEFKKEPKMDLYLTYASFDYLINRKVITHDDIDLIELGNYIDQAEPIIKRKFKDSDIIRLPKNNEYLKDMLNNFLKYNSEIPFQELVYEQVKKTFLWNWFKNLVDNKIDFIELAKEKTQLAGKKSQKEITS